MNASDIMTRDLITVAPETTLFEIAHLLRTRRITALPVVDPLGRMLGMVSDGDLARRPPPAASARWWWSRLLERSHARHPAHGREPSAADVMSREVVMVDEDTPLKKLIELLARRRIRRVPVLRDGRLVGMVSRVDILRLLAAHPSMADVRQRQWTHAHAG